MAKREKAIRDIDLASKYEACILSKIPLTPQCKIYLFTIAEELLSKELLRKSTGFRCERDVELAWRKTEKGMDALRKARNLALDRSSKQAKTWFKDQFYIDHPEFKPFSGRPKGALNWETRVALRAGELIATLLNRCSHDL